MIKKRQLTKKQIKIKNLIEKQIDKLNLVNLFKLVEMLSND